MYNRRFVFAAACLGMLLFGIVFLSLGSVVNLLQAKFNLNNNSIGTLTAILPFGILAGSFVFGPVVDRYGYKTLLIACALLVMAGLEGVAFAKSVGQVQTCIFLIGLGGGILNGGTNALVADVSAGERGAKLSLLGVFFGIGALGMPGMLAVLAKHFSQENIVAGIGMFVLVPVVFFLLVRFPLPKQPQGLSWGTITAMLREPLLWLMGLVLFFQSGLEGTTNDWSPRYLKLVLQSSDKSALYALTIYVAALTLTRLILGGLLKRISSYAVLYASFACAILGSICLLLAHGYAGALSGMVLLGIGYAACFPVVLGYIGDRYASASGTAFSIAFIFALIGNMSINKSMGRIAQQYGIEQFSKVLLGSLVAITILLTMVIRQMRKSKALAPMAQAEEAAKLVSS